MSDKPKQRGHCLCGEVTYEYEGPENWRAHCHCESCRRNTSSAFTTFMGVPRSACRFTGRPLSVYVSSPGVRRLFCSNCGTPMAYETDRYPDEIHLYAASLENPENFEPRFHVHYAERLSWADINDGLRRYDRSGDA